MLGRNLIMLTKFLRDESGATAIEYGLIAALVSIAAIAAMGAMGRVGTIVCKLYLSELTISRLVIAQLFRMLGNCRWKYGTAM